MELSGTIFQEPIRLHQRFRDAEDADRFRRLEMSRYREDPENITTIMPVHEHVQPPEPERIRKSVEEEMTRQAREGEVDRLREHWQAQRGTIELAISVLREAGMRDPALRAIERRLAALDSRLLDSVGLTNRI